jgi:hypothetical protein
MFTKNDFDIIGYMNDGSKTRLENSLNVGQFCKSGIAVIINATAAMCVQISEVRSNANNFAAKADSPFFCDLSKTYATPTGCRYQYRSRDGALQVIAEDYCECSMDATLNANNTGVCPFPDQTVLQTYVDSLKIALEKSECHSDDWLNWLAQKECGIGAKKDTKEHWEKLVDASFNMSFWPQIQAGNNSLCLQQVMQQSRLNLEKSSAYRQLYLSLVGMATLMLAFWM